MRAGRLVSLMITLQQRGRVTAAQLADEFEVSQRTILRDIEARSGAGVPVFATRGPGGGFALLDGFTQTLPDPADWRPTRRRAATPRRATVRISPQGRQLAAVLGILQPLRVTRTVAADDNGWVQATFRLATINSATVDILSLSPNVDVLDPPALRKEVGQRIRAAATLFPA